MRAREPTGHDALVHWIGIADPRQPARTIRSIFRPEPKQLLPLAGNVREMTALSISEDTELDRDKRVEHPHVICRSLRQLLTE